MKERPILFSTEMVQAILNGKKMTRRIIKHPRFGVVSGDHNLGYTLTKEGTALLNGPDYPDGPEDEVQCPYGQIGDILWVRETWCQEILGFHNTYFYKSIERHRNLAYGNNWKWKPSIHMPKSAARIWLMVQDISLEPVQDISEEDAIAEGCSPYGPFREYRGSIHPGGGMMRYRAYSKASSAFQCIWESINGEKSWKYNPWVWVVKFKEISRTGRDDAYTFLRKEVSA